MFNTRRRRPRFVSLEGPKHLGIVVNNVDPLKQERVQTRIKGVHDQIPDADLPWHKVLRPGSHANTSSMGSIGPIPPIGTSLVISYDDETMYHGTYHGPPTTNQQKTHELYGGDQNGQDYPNVHSFIDPGGSRYTYNHKRQTMDIEHVSGSYMSVDGYGHMAIKATSKKVGQDASQNHSSSITIESQGDVTVNAANNLILGGSVAKIVTKGDLHLLAGGDMYIGAKGTIYQKKPVEANPQVPAVNAPAQPTSRSVPQASAPADPTKGTA
jgi:hypothetical protein